MSRVTLNEAEAAKFPTTGERVYVYDSQGRILGQYQPIPREALEPPISDEELDLIERESGGRGRTLAEILADLERRA